jgi:hypothetical protein
MFSETFAYIKNLFKSLRKNLCFDAQNAELDFKWPSNTLKQRFIDFTKFVF